MYQHFFGLREPPFSLTPDTSFYFNHSGQQQALNVLLIALRTGEGFIKITGEVGTGKTLLCRKLLDALEATFVTAYLPNPLLAPQELMHAVALELALEPPPRASCQELLQLLSARLLELRADGRQVVVCIDEAQAVPQESLEALRLFGNLETEKRKLLQVVLFAQPELNERLGQRSLRQLQQRITFAYDLTPLRRDEIGSYVAHRLRIAGYQGNSLFHPRALQAIYRASGGIPRLVNILCHKALLAAYGQGLLAVDRPQVQAAIRDSAATVQANRNLGPRLLYWSLGLLGAGQLALLLYLLRGARP